MSSAEEISRGCDHDAGVDLRRAQPRAYARPMHTDAVYLGVAAPPLLGHRRRGGGVGVGVEEEGATLGWAAASGSWSSEARRRDAVASWSRGRRGAGATSGWLWAELAGVEEHQRAHGGAKRVKRGLT